MKPTKLFLFLAVAVLLGACAEKTRKIHCHIEGTVPDSTYTMMLLAPSGSNFRAVDADSIPVVDGKFAFDLYVDEVMPYDLISMEEFNHGSWYTCVFFAEEGVVDITFYHSERDAKTPSFVSVSPTNKRYLQYIAALQEMTDPLKHEADSLKKVGKWNTPRMMKLETEFREAKDDQTKLKLAQEAITLQESGEAFTPEYYAFQTKSRRVREERDKYIEDYMRNDRSVIGLNLLRHQALRSRNTSRDLELSMLKSKLFPN